MALSKPEAASGPKTLITPDQAREIVRHYNLTLRGLWPLARGTINSNYLIDTDAGPLFLRVSEGKLSADAQFEAGLIWHLGSRGLRTPALWRTRSGDAYVPLPRLSSAHAKAGAGQPVMLMSCVQPLFVSSASTTAACESTRTSRRCAPEMPKGTE